MNLTNDAPTKQQIRALMREREKQLTPAELSSRSEEIMRRFESLPEFLHARTVLLYVSIPGEVETLDFIGKWAGSKRIALPLVKGEELELRLYRPDGLTAGYRGIPEPSSSCPVIDPAEIDLAIVPGTAFQADGEKVWRLGRGKGFYDRLLPHLSCPLYAAAFHFRLVGNLPVDAWDIPLDGICTEKEGEIL